MSSLFNKVLNFVGLEGEEEEFTEEVVHNEAVIKPDFTTSTTKKNKVVNIHSNEQLKVIVMHPESFEEAKDIADHLKSKKPIVINLEDVDKEIARRIIDFLSGSVYSLDGNIQKVANGIFLIAPYNVDILGDFKDELHNKGMFPWQKL